MKQIVFTSTLVLHLFIIYTLKLLDNFLLIILILIASVTIGFVIRKFSENKESAKNLGSGIFYGSITSLIILIVFSFWLSNNFPG